jgi:hypothetical protein
MPVQPLALRQEQSAAQCQNGDRFIPHRCQIKRQDFHYTKILAETSKEKDILKQVMICNLDVSWHYHISSLHHYTVFTTKASSNSRNHFCKICTTGTGEN